MAGIDSCTSSVGEAFNPHDSIIEDSQDSLSLLKEESDYVSAEAFQNLGDVFNMFFENKVFNSSEHLNSILISAVQIGLEDFGFSSTDLDTISKINDVLKANGLSSIGSSTMIVINDEGNYLLRGSISKLTCVSNINTAEFTPQDAFPFSRNKRVLFYGEVLYDFPDTGFVLGNFDEKTNSTHIFEGVINEINRMSSNEEKKASVNRVVANELGHLQFHEVIAPVYGITENSNFEYGGKKYAYFQVHELWSDFSSLTQALKDSRKYGNMNSVNDGLERIIGLSHSIVGYDLTRIFWLDMQNITPKITNGDHYMSIAEIKIKEILENAIG